MADSAWIVLLPLVGAILGAVVGAFGGAWANSWYRDREAKKALQEERKGLLIIVSSEVKHNTRFLDLIYDGKPSAVIQNLWLDTWDRTQVRFAQLFPADYTEEIVNYYSVLAVSQVSPIAHKTKTSDLTEDEVAGIQLSLTQGLSIMDRAKVYIEEPVFAASVDEVKRHLRMLN